MLFTFIATSILHAILEVLIFLRHSRQVKLQSLQWPGQSPLLSQYDTRAIHHPQQTVMLCCFRFPVAAQPTWQALSSVDRTPVNPAAQHQGIATVLC